jgi:hypothetical protein
MPSDCLNVQHQLDDDEGAPKTNTRQSPVLPAPSCICSTEKLASYSAKTTSSSEVKGHGMV